ncbi:MAG TPA: ethanolamine ammonia-lyase subunit EutC [Leptospiraceae bacterium]|nr:ethanolamine ammonia-lyase subunit EutC [Leptospiraceae bacterium]HMW04404.1 ethanolamine ammonia-lyase subunit EutC [Leptospiraceae bacterium]HMY34120.1 ethanolamine ammonia-lyase subunit EutC [Leptospiraceae bacterium]HMZ63831.1 ethanolamine ammonia-lyase subunit EutC [Leptospiraceae bacterium]HNA10218.1 ethanolamine ammonia-lyase subunit EutC [Leptospiraceae bacterium]
MPQKEITKNLDPWTKIKQHTAARIGIGRSGVGIPTKELLQFQMAHAKARDAVLTEINFSEIKNWLRKKYKFQELESACESREEYLTRPDKGRILSDSSKKNLSKKKTKSISICIVDGLSSSAIEKNSIPLLKILNPKLEELGFTLSFSLVKNGRVAIGDEISSLEQTDISLVLIGERPGLSSPDSLGAYLTYKPKKGFTDEKRNCISNIRIGGLDYKLASDKILYLVTESYSKKLSGVNLKDNLIA